MFLAVPIVDGVVCEQAVVVPDRPAVATPPAAQCPARERLAGIPLALAAEQHGTRSKLLLQPPDQHAGAFALLWSERRSAPFGAVHVVDRDERRLTTHREPDVGSREIPVDLFAERRNLRPLFLRVRAGHARRLMDPTHVHLVREHTHAL